MYIFDTNIAKNKTCVKQFDSAEISLAGSFERKYLIYRRYFLSS